MADSRLEWDLYLAAKSGNEIEVKRLLEDNVSFRLRFNDKDEVDPASGLDAFYIAVKNGHTSIVKLFLEAGADPNSQYRELKYTVLHSAVFNNHLDVVNLLITYKADVNAKDYQGSSPIDYQNLLNNPEIKVVMKRAGAIKSLTQRQKKLQENYNAFCLELNKSTELNKHKVEYFKPLDEMGNCDGLSKIFVFYGKQQRLDEFSFCIHFMTSLSSGDIPELVQSYGKNSNLKVRLPQEFDQGICYSFNKILEFIRTIHDAQFTQLKTHYKSINANWDASNIFSCPLATIASHLKDMKIMDLDVGETAKFKFFHTGSHVTALSIIKEEDDDVEAYYFDSNFNDTIRCHDENELASALKITIKLLNSHSLTQANFMIDHVSYGDEHRELDDLLAANAYAISKQNEMQTTVERYKKGCLSRRATAFILQQQMPKMITQHYEFYVLNRKLQIYLDNYPLKHFMPPSTDINQKINSYEHTWLHLACKNGNLELTQQLIASGADMNFKDKYSLTPQALAVTYNHEHIDLFIMQQQSVNNIMLASDITDSDHIALILSKLFYSYAHPPLFSIHWREHRALADAIAIQFKQHPTWDGMACRNALTHLTKDNICNKVGSFAGILLKAHQLIDESINKNIIKMKKCSPL